MEEEYKELNFDNLEFHDNPEEYEFYCDSCKQGFMNIRPEKHTWYDDEGIIIREEWLTLCPVCGCFLN